MALALGTAQFGLDYGIKNSCGKTSLDEVRMILSKAGSLSVEYIDTGARYGDSESVIGRSLPSGHSFKLITKSIICGDNESDWPREIESGFHSSLKNLGCDSIYGFLLHNGENLNQEVWHKLQSLRSQGLVEKIGVSAYDPEQVKVWAREFDFDLIQVPVNIFDKRFLNADVQEFCKERKIEMHARSVFLQGLLLMESHSLPPYFSAVKDQVENFANRCKDANISRLAACLSFLHTQEEVAATVVGVESLDQLEEISSARTAKIEASFFDFPDLEEKFRNPALWQEV